MSSRAFISLDQLTKDVVHWNQGSVILPCWLTWTYIMKAYGKQFVQSNGTVEMNFRTMVSHLGICIEESITTYQFPTGCFDTLYIEHSYWFLGRKVFDLQFGLCLLGYGKLSQPENQDQYNVPTVICYNIEPFNQLFTIIIKVVFHWNAKYCLVGSSASPPFD